MIRPRVFAFTETEIWPNLIIELSRRGIPIILANARMSERTHQWYRLAGPMTRELFARYDRFHYRSECDSKRYESLGAQKVSGVVAGDMKFDAPPHRIEKAVLDNYARVLRGEKKARLIIAGSTRTGEDDILLDALQQIRRTWPDTRMAIAPRHIERSSEIVSLASRRGLNASLWEELKTSSDIVVINKVGMLGDLYAVCDIAFVGGTLVNIGGHNLLEPVWSGRPVLFGPHTSNVAEACQFILQSNLGCQVKDANDLTSIVCDFFAQKRSFAKPERVEPEHSATHLTGEYILSKLSND